MSKFVILGIVGVAVGAGVCYYALSKALRSRLEGSDSRCDFCDYCDDFEIDDDEGGEVV